MRRKDNDKRVLRGRPNNNVKNKRVLRGRPNNNVKNKKPFGRRNSNQPVPVRQNRKKRKTNKTAIILMVVALLAFVIGAGIGVSMTFDKAAEEATPEYENVTVEMTTNLNETEEIYFDASVDDVDYNSQQDLAELNITNDTLNY